MPYSIALLNAEQDAELYRASIIEQDAARSRIVLIVSGEIVGIYPYKD